MKRISREDGFTLTEVLVAMLMMMLVLFALYSMFDMSLRVFKVGNDNTKASASARTAMDRMEREVRSAWNQSGNCSTGTTSGALLEPGASTSQVAFYNCFSGSDIPIKVKYLVNASNELTRAQGSTADPATPGTPERLVGLGSGGSLSLAYFTKENVLIPTVTTSTVGSVALVRITLKTTSGDSTQTLTNNIALRNRS